MESREESGTTKRRRRSKTGTHTTGSGVKGSKDRNERRREQYHSDETYREAIKKKSRQSYRKDNPKAKPSIPAKIDVAEGKKELLYNDEVVYCHAYTLPKAAEALGKTYLTLKRWVDDGLIPEPVLIDSTYSYLHYSKREIEAIATCLRSHAVEYDYFHYTHQQTIVCISQKLEAIRRENLF